MADSLKNITKYKRQRKIAKGIPGSVVCLPLDLVTLKKDVLAIVAPWGKYVSITIISYDRLARQLRERVRG